MGLFRAIGNTLVTAVLRSPLHPLLSRGTMLITVTGRRTGRRYTTPVQYARRDGHLFVVSRQERTWWQNLRGGGAVTVRLRGRTWTGRGSVVTGLDDIRRAQGALSGSLAGAARRSDAVIVEIVLD